GTETRELHVAFKAPDRAAIDAVHQAAVAAGVEVLHAPREFPEYHPGYYGVFLRDLDGHNVEAVHHGYLRPAPGDDGVGLDLDEQPRVDEGPDLEHGRDGPD